MNSKLNILRRGKLYILMPFLAAVLIWFIIYMDANYYRKTYNREMLMKSYNSKVDNNEIIFNGEKIVHIDLKGAPPKISYYQYFFSLILKLGATGILIEYEDMFPYYGDLGNISAGNAYSLKDIQQINNMAYEMNLKVIPLIQTFGHLEFLLKNMEYQHLREVIKYPQVICPSNPKTLPVLKEMIKQVIQAHPHSDMIHIGSDEVYIIGKCTECYKRMYKEGYNKDTFFLEHVTNVAQEVKKIKPNIRILVWDDEFRKLKLEDLENSDIVKLVEPVVWDYKTNVFVNLGPSLWEMYEKIFPKIWIASAFKGATGSNKYITDAEYHIENHRSWMQIVNEYSGKIKFEGIMLTGWQRYDHFSVLCELLPVGIPSLAMCLHHIGGILSEPLTAPKNTANILNCKNPYALLGTELGSPNCRYPGGEILENIIKLHLVTRELNNLLDSSVVRGWMSDYNLKNKYSNAFLIESSMENVNMIRMELFEIENNLRVELEEIYDNYTVSEWCETYLEPIQKQVEHLWDAKQKLLDSDYWPRRPFSTKNEL